MKKILIGLILVCIVLVSCKKEHKVTPSASTIQKVTFSVNFSQTTGIISSHSSLRINSLATNSAPDTSLTNHIATLYYMVFDSKGTLVHNITQLSSDTAFGHYTDNLHSGTYTVAVAGCSNVTLVNGNLNDEYLSGQFTNDAFFERFSVSVANAPLAQPVMLNRITSKITVNINDALPQGATYGKVSLMGVGTEYFVGTDQVAISTAYGAISPDVSYIYSIPAAADGTTNYQMSGLFLYMAPFTTGIVVSQNSNSTSIVYGDKVLSNVTGAPNTITYLSGTLFGGSGTNSSGGFQITADTAWNTPIIKTFP